MLSSCFTTTTTTTPVGATRVVRLKRAAACFTFPMRTLSRRREVNVTPRAENDDSPKVHVPCGAFGGTSSPERKAADVMHQLLTYTATWVVIGQLESINCRLNVQTPDGLSTEVNLDGQGEAKRVNNQHEFLLKFLEENPIGRQNPDEWLAKLSKADQSLANRIMTARQGYANMDFEWKSMEALAKKDIENGNKKLQTRVLESMMGGSATDSNNSSA